MAVSSELIAIQELAVLNPEYWWRIDWLGNVYRRRSHHVQHMIEIFLSPVYSNSTDVIVSPTSADSNAQVRIELGVGYLPMLYIGAVFKAGKVVPLRPQDVMRVRLRISPVTSQLISLEKPLERHLSPGKQPEPLLPFEFKIGPRAWPSAASSHILATADVSNRDPYYVMIPSIELARFFFCTSSVLARSLFAHGWADLIWREKCDLSQMPKQITVGLQTVKGLREADARHLAYKLLNPYTDHAINAITQSLQATSSTNPKRLPIPCAFPFQEDVEIEAEVIRIPTGTKLGKRYFVTRLLSCNRPIPFDICFVHPMLHRGQGANWDSPDLIDLPLGNGQALQTASHAGGRGKIFSNMAELEEEGWLSDDGGPPANTDEIIYIASPEIRFPGLSSVPTPLSLKDTQQYKSAPGNKPIPVEGKGASTGTPAGSKPIVPGSIETDLAAKSDQTIAWLRDAAPLLEEAGYDVSKPISKALDVLAEDYGRFKSWARVNYSTGEGTGGFRSRLLLVLQIRRGNETAVVAEIERKPGEQFGLAIFFVPQSIDPSPFLEDLVVEIAKRKGWPLYDLEEKCYWLNNDNLRFEGDRGFHTFVNCAEDIASKIGTLLRRRTG